MKRFLLGIFALIFSGQVLATVSWVHDAKIEKVEFYGNQFTVYFDKAHSAKGCGHPGNVVAVDSATQPGIAHFTFFLAAYTANKTVSVKISDESCNGDRPKVLVITGTN